MLGRAGTCSDCAGSWSQVQSHARGSGTPENLCESHCFRLVCQLQPGWLLDLPLTS